jgi:hypothetical protein
MFIHQKSPLYRPTRPHTLAAAALEPEITQFTLVHIVHEDLLPLSYVFLRAETKSLKVHNFCFLSPLAAFLTPSRRAHDADGEEVRVHVFFTARVLRELAQALLPGLTMFDQIV